MADSTYIRLVKPLEIRERRAAKVNTNTTGSFKPDGRSLRKNKTRIAIIDALLDLLKEGQMNPAARKIALRAGVSERSVFQHFSDLDELSKAVAERQYERARMAAGDIQTKGPLLQRIEKFVSYRAVLNEELTPARRASLAKEPLSSDLKRMRDNFSQNCFDQVHQVFATELKRYSKNERMLLGSAIDSVSSWYAWEHLRQLGYSIEDAKDVIRCALKKLLAPPPRFE